MCGISGIIQKNNNPVDAETIRRMNDLVSHRGPDSYGYFHGPGFSFGHRRLSIIDLTDHGHQPMTYQGKYTIVYNGEVYNYIELRDELREAGMEFLTDSDTEVLLAAYARWGTDCVHHFNGMWAFALFDAEKRNIFCSRDRFGVKPLYYYPVDSLFAFASEIKQFTALDEWRAVLNRERAADFLIKGIFDHSEETMFRGVFQLRGGCSLLYDLGNHSYSVHRWYDLTTKIEKTAADFADAKCRFRDMFTDAVNIRLRSDVKLGSCLSGGLDSSAIVCAVNGLLRDRNAHDKQETVSSCFTIEKYDEQPYIDAVSQKTGAVNHKVFPAYGELFRDIDRILYHQDEPFGSTSIYAQWNVFRTAREHGLIVMLDGQGADEQLAGYHYTFYGAYFASLLRRFRFVTFLKELGAFRRLHGYSLVYAAKVIAGAMMPHGMMKPIKKLIGTSKPTLVKLEGYNEHRTAWKRPGNIREESIVELLYTSLPMLLHYEDRDSMAHSVESRVPFLDYRLVEFVAGLPESFKIQNGVTKFIMREALREMMPEKITNRYDKMGFVTPEEMWMKENGDRFKGELAEAVELSKGFLTGNILPLFDDYVRGRRPFDFLFWRFVIFGRWLKLFKVEI